MADDEKDEEVTVSRGVDWEVVQLTASTYAAAPSPQEIDPDDCRFGHESSSALFLSSHFVFPPSEHENLPIAPDISEIHGDPKGQDESFIEEEDEGDGAEERRLVKCDDNLQGTELFDGGSTLSVHGMEFEEGSGLRGMYSVPHPITTDIPDPGDSFSSNRNSPPKQSESSEEDKYDGSDIPSEGWWKRHSSSLYHHAKEANTFWSIFVVAALTGLVILGNRWHRDNWQADGLKRHLSVNDEKMNRVLAPLSRFKDVIIGSHQRSSLIGGDISVSR